MKQGKQLKKIIAAALAVLFVAFAILSIRGLQGGGSAADAKHGVVYIREMMADQNGNVTGASGTGWMIGEKGKDPEYIVTNGHVVQDYWEVKQGTSQYYVQAAVEVYFSAAENSSDAPQVVYYSPVLEKDLAILKLPSPTDKRVPLSILDSDEMQPGDEVYAIGYPGISSQTQEYVTYDEGDATLTRGIISKITNSYLTNGSMFELDAVINHGNSGGPLVDASGNVVGVNESISQETVLTLDANGDVTTTAVSNDLGYAITSKEVLKVLDAEKIPYTLARSSGGMERFLYPVLAVLSLAGAFVLFLGGKGAKAGGSAPALAAAGNMATAGMQAVPAGSGRAVLKSIAGPLAGRSFPAEGTLVIGRDGAICNVVFDKGTPGVSGRHCEVRYDAAQDAFLLTDTGSSFGTFLENDKKLAANVPVRLASGDGFYLANRNIRFLVTKE